MCSAKRKRGPIDADLSGLELRNAYLGVLKLLLFSRRMFAPE
jgi:hypothetical protein